MATKEEAKESRFVYAIRDCALHDKDGIPFQVHAAQVWFADDPLVKQWPGEFAAEPPKDYVGHSA